MDPCITKLILLYLLSYCIVRYFLVGFTLLRGRVLRDFDQKFDSFIWHCYLATPSQLGSFIFIHQQRNSSLTQLSYQLISVTIWPLNYPQLFYKRRQYFWHRLRQQRDPQQGRLYWVVVESWFCLILLFDLVWRREVTLLFTPTLESCREVRPVNSG